MKALINLILFILVLTSKLSYSQETNFSKGYQKGYREGYCYKDKLNCVGVIPPLTPLSDISEGRDSYQDGYNRGFIDGQNQKKVDNSQNTIPNSSYGRRPADYGQYTPTLNLELINKVLAKKQAQYDRKKRSSIDSKENFYLKEIWAGIEYYYNQYNSLNAKYYPLVKKYFFVEQFLKSLQKDFSEFEKVLNDNYESMNTKDLELFHQKLAEMSHVHLKKEKAIQQEVNSFTNNPNYKFLGNYQVIKVSDYQLDSRTEMYLPVGTIISEGNDDFIFLTENRIIFKRPDWEKTKANSIKYIENSGVIIEFYDDRNQLIQVHPYTYKLDYYYEPNASGVYKKRTTYYFQKE